jgi:hypothetical protein
MKTLVAAVTTLFAVLLLAAPAAAKGPESVSLTGPGLDEPVEPPSYIQVALQQLASPHYTSEPGAHISPSQPPVTLNEKYTLTWVMAKPPSADQADYTVVQDIYPHSAAGPLVHIHPSPYVDDKGGWYAATDALTETIEAVADAEQPVSTQPVATTTTSDRTGSTLVASGGAFVVGAALGAGTVLARRRRAQ